MRKTADLLKKRKKAEIHAKDSSVTEKDSRHTVSTHETGRQTNAYIFDMCTYLDR